jgi:hypothetical protein
MKKTISILAAFMLVFSVAGTAFAQYSIPFAGSCDPAGKIDRGCYEPDQFGCETSPFDYEDYGACALEETTMDSYCPATTGKDSYHRAFIPICDCIAQVSDFDEPVAGDVYDVGMEILVDKGDGVLLDGDNGVYFAQNVNASGIPVRTLSAEDCTDDLGCSPLDHNDRESNTFAGEWSYLLGNGKTTDSFPNTGSACVIGDDERIVAFEPDPTGRPETYDGSYGYQVTQADVLNGRSTWWVDIPALRVDSTITERGWKVFVKVTVQDAADTASGGLCSDCPKCEHIVEIGTLCCDSLDETCSGKLVFPYFGKSDGAWWNGMAVSNLGSTDGTASVTLYENDGDSFTGTVDVDAYSTAIVYLSELSGTGTIGDAQGFVVVNTDFNASGFAMMAKESNGVSMGYLAEKPEGCNSCDPCNN